MHYLYKTKLSEISSILLSLLILSINMNGPDFFKTKELFFFLFVLVSLNFGDYNRVLDFLLMFSILLFTDVLNLIIPGSTLNPTEAIKNSLGLIYLFVLVYNKDQYKNVIIKSYLFSALCVAVFTIVIWCICISSRTIQNALIAYFSSIKNEKTAFVLQITKKKIIKWWLLGVYYGTAPCMIPALGYFLIYGLKNKKNKYFIFEVLLTAGLIMSGTRANMMAAILLDFFYFGFTLLRHKHYTIAVFLLLLVCFLGCMVAYLFLTTKEASLSVKTLHQKSYNFEFDNDLPRALLYGWGAGSTFYTEGFKRYTNLTELSHLETIRRYGFINTMLILFCIWLKPILIIEKKEKSILKFFYALLLISYILVACTNPYLLGGIGFCALLFMTTFFERGFLEKNMKKRKFSIKTALILVLK